MSKFEAVKNEQLKFIQERNWMQFDCPKNLSMALTVEAGELMEIFMWLKENHIENLETKFPHLIQSAREEIADIFLYLIRIANTLNIDLLDAASEKIKMNEDKYSIEKGQELAKTLRS